MDDLISKKSVMPGSLFITDVKTSADVSSVTLGGFGRVFKGEHKGQQVALKVLSRSQRNVSSFADLVAVYRSDFFDQGSPRKDIGREALAWASLTKHRYVLPLMGVFEDKLRLFLVLPSTTNGTLSEWRKKKPPLGDIHSRVSKIPSRKTG